MSDPKTAEECPDCYGRGHVDGCGDRCRRCGGTGETSNPKTAARPQLANQGAIPGTGKRSGGHFFRQPRNGAVKRALVAILGTLRGVKTPPDDYDDGSISTWGHRSWKRHRRTRWRQAP